MAERPYDKEKQAQRRNKWLAKPGSKETHKAAVQRWNAANIDYLNDVKAERRFKIKLQVIAHYSKGTMACNACGYNANIDALCLDHIEENGAVHRKDIGSGGFAIFDRIKRDGWLPGLQVLCANCNHIKGVEAKRRLNRTSVQMMELAKIARSPGKRRDRKPLISAPPQIE